VEGILRVENYGVYGGMWDVCSIKMGNISIWDIPVMGSISKRSMHRELINLSIICRAVQSVHKSSDSDSFIKAQYALITVNL
jgi:hypothetical protein